MKYEEFRFSKEDFLSQNAFLDLTTENPDILLFIKTDVLKKKSPIIWNNKIHPGEEWPPHQRVWITGHSDYSIEAETLRGFRGIYKRLFSVNVDTEDICITPIPLGIDTHICIKNKDHLWNSMQQPKRDDILAFKSFSLATYPGERCVIDHLFNECSWVYSEFPLPIEEYYNIIRRSKFVFCPRGNGFDTHRLWEVLYLGAIPIVRASYLMNYFAKSLPICIIHSWTDITNTFLESEYERIMSSTNWDPSILKMSWWREKILTTAKECAQA